jgi:hypothetical protein
VINNCCREVFSIVKQNQFSGLQRENWNALMLMASIYQTGKDTKKAETYYKQALEYAKNIFYFFQQNNFDSREV